MDDLSEDPTFLRLLPQYPLSTVAKMLGKRYATVREAAFRADPDRRVRRGRPGREEQKERLRRRLEYYQVTPGEAPGKVPHLKSDDLKLLDEIAREPTQQ